jgi:SAM-dependent methyltransferase
MAAMFEWPMADFDDPVFYGDTWASVYDEGVGRVDPEPAVAFLAEMADGGRVLELAIGTGRVALPLARRGVDVHGLDASAAMVERMRAKPGGDVIDVTIGDMADVPLPGPFRLVYLVSNTLFGLLTPDRQADCFRNVARVLDPSGRFVIECFVPDPGRFDRGQRVQAIDVTEHSATLEVSLHDAATQRVRAQHIKLDADGVHRWPVAIRYAWPAELDLMAAAAGLKLRDRCADWDRSPFTSASAKHVSVYEA